MKKRVKRPASAAAPAAKRACPESADAASSAPPQPAALGLLDQMAAADAGTSAVNGGGAAAAAVPASHDFHSVAVDDALLRMRAEGTKSILDLGGDAGYGSDASVRSGGSGSSSSYAFTPSALPSFTQSENRNVLASFIERRSEFFVEPEPALTSARDGPDSVHTLLSAAKDAEVVKRGGTVGGDEAVAAAAAAASADGFGEFMGLDDDDGAVGGGGPAAVEVGDLPMAQRLPVWVGAGAAASVPWRGSAAVALHWELRQFVAAVRADKARRQQLRTVGKAAMQMVVSLVESDVAGFTVGGGGGDADAAAPDVLAELVGSLSTRLARHSSDVNISLRLAGHHGGASATLDVGKLRAALRNALLAAAAAAAKATQEEEGGAGGQGAVAAATAAEWEVVEGQRHRLDGVIEGVECLTLKHLPTELSVVFMANDVEGVLAQAANFVSKRQQLYGDRLECLVHVLSEMCRQRVMGGAPSTYEATLLAVAYLNNRCAARTTAEQPEDSSLGALLADFLCFLVFRFNSYAVALNPADAAGRVLAKDSPAFRAAAAAAPMHHLHIVDPITRRNAAFRCYNWGVTRDTLEQAVVLLADGGGGGAAVDYTGASDVQLHSHHPLALCRPTLLSRILLSEKVKTAAA